MGHQSRVNPFRYFPTYRTLADLPFAERMGRLATPEVRAAILAERPEYDGPPALDHVGRRSFDALYPLGATLDYEPAADASVGAMARRTGQDPWAVAYDVLLGADGREFLLFPLLNYAGGSYDGVHDMMADPTTVQGLGDGGAHCGVICDASMTTYLLSHWVRDRTRGPRFPLEWAVRRLTRDPAELYGLGDRGVVAEGFRADLNLIDAGAVGLRRPELVTDLPGGAGRLVQRSTGYVATIVAGETVVDAGRLTDARPGTVVRGPRPVGA
jgi:N-acyl-D-aspartate/D-glutamate deacylase